MSPQRIRLRRASGWRKPDGMVVVSRPSKWGNPFRYRTTHALARVPALDGSSWEYEGRISANGALHPYHHPDGHVTEHNIRYMTRAECVDLYHRALTRPTPQLRLWNHQDQTWVTVEDVQRELTGRDLACWCPLDVPCHADVLLKLANPGGAA